MFTRTVWNRGISILAMTVALTACGKSASVTPKGSTSSLTGGSAGPTITVSPDNITLAPGATQTYIAVGGSGGYTFSASAGSIDAFGKFTAPTTTGTYVITARDTQGTRGYANVYVTTQNPNPNPTNTGSPFQIWPTSLSIQAGQTQDFQANGGVAPYTGTVRSGGGYFQTNSLRYVAPSTPGTVVIDIRDATGQVLVATLTIQSTYDTTPISAQTWIETDHFVGAGYVPAINGAKNPQFAFYGLGNAVTASSLANGDGGKCTWHASGEIQFPCVSYVTLTNFDATQFPTVAYKGTIQIASRRSSARYTIDYCINPGRPEQVLIRTFSSSQFTQGAYFRYFSGGVVAKQLQNGRYNISAYQPVDTASGVGQADITLNGAFTGEADCGSNFSLNNAIQFY